jgi:GT2 family glycosyltransferase
MGRDEYLAMGGLDAELFLYFNDVDLCRRLAQRGRRVHYLADAEVVHHGGASTRRFDRMIVTWHQNRFAYYRKHHGALSQPLLRLAVRLRAFQEWMAVGRRQRDRAARREERAHLRRMLDEILAPR